LCKLDKALIPKENSRVVGRHRASRHPSRLGYSRALAAKSQNTEPKLNREWAIRETSAWGGLGNHIWIEKQVKK
jgi:hypothetical protein